MKRKLFIKYIEENLITNTDKEVIKNKLWNIQNRSENNSIIYADEIFKSDENILAMLHSQAANDECKPHSHDFFELIYVVKGNSFQYINGERLDLKQGDICILNTQAKHSITTESDDDLLLNIIIKKSLFTNSFAKLIADNDTMSNFFVMSMMTKHSTNPYMYFSAEENDKCIELIHNLVTEYCEKNILYKNSMEFYLVLLFAEFLRIHRDSVDAIHYDQMGSRLSSVLNYINQNKTTVTLSSVADHFGYHPNYLSSLIKQHTNQSFSNLIKMAKLEEACFQLANTDSSIDDIVSDMGYYDRSYFYRVFKAQYNITPTQYRKLNRQAH